MGCGPNPWRRPNRGRVACRSSAGRARADTHRDRPETRGVGGADLVAERQLAGRVDAELELGVGQDDPACERVLGAVAVDRERGIAQALGQIAVADQSGRALEIDRLVVADLGLGRGGEDRLWQPVGLLEAGRELDPRDLAAPLVVLPAGPAEIPAHDAFDRQHPQPFDDHRATADLVRHALGDRLEMAGDDPIGLLEPERREPREHGPLVWNRGRMDHVVGRDPVGCDE